MALPYIGTCETSRNSNRNLVLIGTTTHCHVPSASDSTSIKAVLQGTVDWSFGRRRYLLRPDSVLLVPDGEEYSLTIDSVQPSSGFNVRFRRGLVEECWRAATTDHETLLDEPEVIPSFSFPRRLESRARPLGHALDALAAAVLAKKSPEMVDWLFEALGERAAESLREQRRESHRVPAVRSRTRLEIHRRLCLAREAIEDDLASSWTLTKMARAAMMAPHHFHRCFRAVFREPPRAWLSRRRAERAMALLRSTNDSVMEICVAVGYTSPSSFSTSFAARYGMSPSRVPRSDFSRSGIR